MTETLLGTCAITAILGKRTETFTISFVSGILELEIKGLTAVAPADYLDLVKTKTWLEELFANATLEAANDWLLGDSLVHLGARPNGLSYRRRKQLDLCVRTLLCSFSAKKGKLTWEVTWTGFENYKLEDHQTINYGLIRLPLYSNRIIYLVDDIAGIEDVADKENLKAEAVEELKKSLQNKTFNGKTYILTNRNCIVLLNLELIGKENISYSEYFSVIAHEATHVVMSICGDIGYNPVKEDEPAAYLLGYICRQAVLYFCPELRKSNLEMK